MTGCEFGDVAHDPTEFVVLGRVHTGHAHGRKPGAVLLGDDSAENDGRIDADIGETLQDVGHEREVRAAQDRQPDHVGILVSRGRCDLLRSEPDAAVDDFHPGIAGSDGDLLGAVRVAVETGLGDEEPRRPTRHRAHVFDNCGQLVAAMPDGSGDARRRTVLAENGPQLFSPFPRGAACPSELDRRTHDVLVGLRRGSECEQGRGDRCVVAMSAPFAHVVDRLLLDRRVDDEDVAFAAERTIGGLGEPVDADDGLRSGFDPSRPLGHRTHESALQLIDRFECAAEREHVVQLLPCRLTQLGGLGLYHRRTVEDVGVLEQVGLECEHLLHPQRPLLIPRPGKPERLVPRRQLHAARPRLLRQRDGEHLEHDSLHVVLRLCFGQPERVDLHAVAEPPCLDVGDAVALDSDLVPQLGERAEFADLFDEADARVDEERDRAENLRELLWLDLTAVAHGVEHADGGCERVRDLLHRRRSGLLEVIRANVGRVPLRSVFRAPRHHVDDQPPRRLWREDVGAAAEILLDDVVLGRAAQRGRRHSLLLGVRDVQGEQPCCRRVDRHRGVHLPRRDRVQQGAHVAEMDDRYADLADLAPGQFVVRVVAGLGRQIERDRKPRLALGEVGSVQLVRCPSRRMTRIRAHHPRFVAAYSVASAVVHPASVIAAWGALPPEPSCRCRER